MEQTLEEEDTLLQAGTIETSEVVLHLSCTVTSGGRHFLINTFMK
jgi:hypothetical protein